MFSHTRSTYFPFSSIYLIILGSRIPHRKQVNIFKWRTSCHYTFITITEHQRHPGGLKWHFTSTRSPFTIPSRTKASQSVRSHIPRRPPGCWVDHRAGYIFLIVSGTQNDCSLRPVRLIGFSSLGVLRTCRLINGIA